MTRCRKSSVWPEESAGRLLAVDVGRRAGGLQVRLLHLGPSLDAAAQEAIQRSLAGSLSLSVAVRDVAIPPQPLNGFESGGPTLTAALSALESAEGLSGITICYTVPKAKPRTAHARGAARALDEALARHQNVSRAAGAGYEIRFSTQACDMATSPSAAQMQR